MSTEPATSHEPAMSCDFVSLATLFPKGVKRWSKASSLPKHAVDLHTTLVPSNALSMPVLTHSISQPLPVSLEMSDEWNTEFWDHRDASQKPFRCFSCSRVLAHRYTPYYIEVYEKKHPVDYALDLLGIYPYRYCCKQMLLSYLSIPVQSVAKGRRVVVGLSGYNHK